MHTALGDRTLEHVTPADQRSPGRCEGQAIEQRPHDLPAEQPRFNWANPAARALFELDADALVRTESRASAPDEGAREERQRLLERVERFGFIDDYAGVRVSSTGRRFRIERATVWNVLQGGAVVGQAACFARATPL